MIFCDPYCKTDSDCKPMQKELLPMNIAFNKKHSYKADRNWKHRNKEYVQVHKKPNTAHARKYIALQKVKPSERIPLESAYIKYNQSDTHNMEYGIKLLQHFISFDFCNNKNHIKDMVRSKQHKE